MQVRKRNCLGKAVDGGVGPPSEGAYYTTWEDNKTAIIHSERATNHNRTRDIVTRYHYLPRQVQAGEIKLRAILTEKQEADILTKNTAAKLSIKLKQQVLGLL